MQEKIWQSWRYILAALGLVVLAWLVIGFNSRMAELRRLSLEAERVNAEYQALLATAAGYDEQIVFATSDAAVEQWAYEQARWVREGDRLIAPIAAYSEEPEVSELSSRPAEAVANWQVWWALFFE
ncbi:MAG: hypothetical protein JW862_19825 [Anaerolineales bacterium]|nr:hypothetical protein [Anaerolineales bacterium]